MSAPADYTEEDVIRERWLRGRLNYKLHAGQKLIQDAYEKSPGQLFVGECSRQYGKTFFEAKLALECAFRKPNARVKIGTAFHTDLVEFIIPAFEAVLSDCPDDLKPIYKVQGSKYVLYNGSEIKLVGLDRKPNGLRGTVIDLIILSEAAFISNLHYLFKSVIIPATTHRPDCRVTMFSTPPESPAHDFLDYVERAQLEGCYIKLTIYQNPLVDETTIERLKRESGGEHSTTWRREYLCEHITDENLAIVKEWDNNYIQDVPHDRFYGLYHRYAAMDLGVKDHTAIIWGYYDFMQAKLIIEDEYVVNGPELTTETLQKAIRNKEEALGYENFYLRISDNNNPLLLQDLSLLHGIHFSPTNKGSLEEMVNTVRVMVSNGQILVHPRCKQLHGCLRSGVWDKNRKGFARSAVYGHFDALAALIYLVRNLDKTTNPIPVGFEIDHSQALIFHRDSKVSQLKNAFGMGKRA